MAQRRAVAVARGRGLVRLARVVEALAAVSDLDLFVFHDQRRSKTVGAAVSFGSALRGRPVPSNVPPVQVAPGLGGAPRSAARGGHGPSRPGTPTRPARLGPSAV